jgi:hypothetical protein
VKNRDFLVKNREFSAKCIYIRISSIIITSKYQTQMLLWYSFASVIIFNYPGLVFHIILTTLVLHSFPELNNRNYTMVLVGNAIQVAIYHTLKVEIFILSNVLYFFMMVYLVGTNLEAQRPKLNPNSFDTLEGTRVAFVNESSEQEIINEALVKSLTGK